MDKIKKGLQTIVSRATFSVLFCIILSSGLLAQKKLPVIHATSEKALIIDGDHVKMDWRLNPHKKPDIYYVDIPLKKSKVTFKTDQDKISFNTQYGESYDFIVLLNGKDSCYTRILAKQPRSSVIMKVDEPYPQSIPFTLIGSRIYIQGHLNGQEEAVNIQFDLGAGGCCVNKMSSEKLQLLFDRKTMVDNSQGINETRASSNNRLTISEIEWSGVQFTEVGNMDSYEDLIIGNGLFRDNIVEINYDKKLVIIHDRLPDYIDDYKKHDAFYKLGMPRIKADIIQGGKKYSFWFGFDTGRDGAMRIGKDFTGQGKNWENLKELQMLNGRKIIRLDAIIAGVKFKDVVTNAADPSDPRARGTIFGNQILNHFNVILDNPLGEVYLKPNSRKDEPYYNYDNYLKEVEEYKKGMAK